MYADVETSTDSYATRFAGAIGSWFLDVQSRIILKLLWSQTAASSILDVGGGHGQIAFPCASHGYQVTVIGSDPSCEHRVRSLVTQHTCRFITGDLLQLPFKEKCFDAVTSIRLIPHCGHWRELIKELCRVANRQVIVDYPPYRSWNMLYGILYSLKKGAEGNTRPFSIFTDSEIEEEFRKHGFCLHRRVPQFSLPMVLYRKLKMPGLANFIEATFRLLGITAIFGSPTIASFLRKEAL